MKSYKFHTHVKAELKKLESVWLFMSLIRDLCNILVNILFLSKKH